MDKRNRTDTLMTAAECAKRIGISVRALRVYEAHGMLSPVRTEKNWRLYGTAEIARLNEIVFLKQLGFSLSEISALLAGQTADIGRLLEMQETLQNKRLEMVERSLKLISRLRAKAGSGDGLSMEDLLELTKETQMSDAANDFPWKRYEQTRPRTEIQPDKTDLEDCAGEYRFADGAVMRVEAREDRLNAQVLGQPDFDLFAEARDHYFLKVTPAQIVFSRDKSGKVDGLTLHQIGYEMAAPRCPAGEFDKSKARLDDRIDSKSAFPGSEALLLKVISDHRKGKPDYDNMSPLLRSLVKEQLPIVLRELERLGAEKSVEFRGVGVDGFDIYIVDFEQGRLEWGLSQGTDGTLNGLYLRPTP